MSWLSIPCSSSLKERAEIHPQALKLDKHTFEYPGLCARSYLKPQAKRPCEMVDFFTLR